MTQGNRINQSPLGSLSQYYRKKDHAHGAILDIPDKGLIELYPTGYTKPSDRDGTNRQEVHKAIWEAAVINSVEDRLFPFGKQTHNLELVHDPSNPYDANAIYLILRASEGPLAHLDGRDMGWIPKRINSNIVASLSMINGGRIYKVRANFHEKYYTTKVVLGYGDTTFGILSKSSMSRFASLLED